MNTQVTAGPARPIVAEKLYLLGGTVPHNDIIHWIPKNAKGEAALNAYLLLEGTKAVLLDTSLPILEDGLVAQIEPFIIDEMKLLLTRAVEFDSIGNADVIIEKWPVKEVWAGYVAYEWVYMRTQGPNPYPPPFESKMIEKQSLIQVAPGRSLQAIDTKLKLLAATWIYDAVTKTLFTSDSFSHVMAPAPGVTLVTADTDTTTVQDVVDNFRAKFFWMEDADTQPLRAFVKDVFGRYDVEHIAPTLGCVISGKHLVLRHVEMLDQALEQLDGKGRPQ
ncbi:hypothetical protein ACWGTI_30105 [Mesorhizobium sp. ArgA1]